MSPGENRPDKHGQAVTLEEEERKTSERGPVVSSLPGGPGGGKRSV